MRASKNNPTAISANNKPCAFAHEPNATPTCITEVLRKNRLSTQYPTQHRPANIPANIPAATIPHPCHSRTQRSAPPPCHSEHSEESKILAHPPFTDLRFLPSLETTRPKSSHPERSTPSLPFPTQPPPSCHSERSTLFPCHSERSALSPLSF